MSNNIDDILAFIDQEEGSSTGQGQDFKTDNFLEKEQARLLKLDNLLSKKTSNLENYSQADYIFSKQEAEKESYRQILNKILIEENLIAETALSKLWNSIFLKN